MTAKLNLGERMFVERMRSRCPVATDRDAASAAIHGLMEHVDQITAQGVGFAIVLSALAAGFVRTCEDLGEAPLIAFSTLMKLDQAGRADMKLIRDGKEPA